MTGPATGQLGDWPRAHAIVPPLSLCGPVLNVRKFSSDPIERGDLHAARSLGSVAVRRGLPMRPARYAASVSDHSYDDDAAMTVVRLAEGLVGEDAYGGAWIDRTLAQPMLGVALVAPQADHVTSIREAAR